MVVLNPLALQQAGALDQKKSNRDHYPLFCVPTVIKDNMDFVGLPTASGSVALNSTYPKQNAFIVQKLLDAGAIVLGKTNMAELAMKGDNSYSSLGGQTLNAYNITVTPMGSSGGTKSCASCASPALLPKVGFQFDGDADPDVVRRRHGNGNCGILRGYWSWDGHQRFHSESVCGRGEVRGSGRNMPFDELVLILHCHCFLPTCSRVWWDCARPQRCLVALEFSRCWTCRTFLDQ